MVGHSACTLTSQTDRVVPHAQSVNHLKIDDGMYHCLNRADEHIFSEKRQNDTNNGTDWLQSVTTPCGLDVFGDAYRRCLGRNPDQCVWVYSKY